MLTPDTPVALTFDDVLLQPAYSSVLPRDVSLKTRLARDLTLNIPLLSSAMDTVTEANTAISMAVEGGLGIIHKNLNPLEQAREVSKVKRAMTGVVSDPITMGSSQTLAAARRTMKENRISGCSRGRWAEARGYPHGPRSPIRTQSRPSDLGSDDPTGPAGDLSSGYRA